MSSVADPPARPVYNCSVGVLGHIDSGKTSLAKALSTTASTASFDRSPQSAERGITLDLGFSSFTVQTPGHLGLPTPSTTQITLVDCPGHASLIRTIIGGASIIDLMLLVIDATKGIQAQTAEGLVVGEICASGLIVVLNKVDLVPLEKRAAHLEKLEKGIGRVLERTRFRGSAFVATSAKDGLGLEELKAAIAARLPAPKVVARGEPFLFAFDHCFQIKGKGTVVTGTVLQGSVKLNDPIEFPSAGKAEKKVKSMQMFREPVAAASKGDRVGICVAQLESDSLERGLCGQPGTMTYVTTVVAAVEPVRYHKRPIETKAKFHLTVGHTTVMCVATFFGEDLPELARKAEEGEGERGAAGGALPPPGAPEGAAGPAPEGEAVMASLSDISKSALVFGPATPYLHYETLLNGANKPPGVRGQFALLELESAVICPADSVIIASRLDTDVHSTDCRIAFFGRVVHNFEGGPTQARATLKIYKNKGREGVVDRVVDDREVIGRGLFKKETDLSLFTGLTVTTSQGARGTIEGGFGKSGKFRAVFRDGHKDAKVGDKIFLRFRRYMFDPAKKMHQ